MGALHKIAAFLLRRADRAAEPCECDRWARDDLAECMFPGPWISSQTGSSVAEPDLGHVAIVRAVHIATVPGGGYQQFLIFARWPDRMFLAAAFRKLTPRADAAQAADAAFIKGLKHRRVVGPSLLDRLAARLAQSHPPRAERIRP